MIIITCDDSACYWSEDNVCTHLYKKMVPPLLYDVRCSGVISCKTKITAQEMRELPRMKDLQGILKT